MKLPQMINELQDLYQAHGDLDVIISVDGVPGFPGNQLNIDTYNVDIEIDNGVVMITGDATED